MQRMTLGTRGSKLAIAQTEMVRARLVETGVAAEIIEHASLGDRSLGKPLYEMKGVGVFVRELNDKIISGEIDAAVHSAKDIPSRIDESLEISAVLERGPFRDVLVAKQPLEDIESGSVIGTSSIRRIKELGVVRPDIRTSNIRGNIQTRLSRYYEGRFDGIVLAEAALERLSVNDGHYVLDESSFVPAPNQGIIAVISRRGSRASEQLKIVDHAITRKNMEIERRIIEELDLGCSTPVGILSRTEGNRHRVTARFFSIGGNEFTDFVEDVSGKEDLDDLIIRMRREIPPDYGYGLR